MTATATSGLERISPTATATATATFATSEHRREDDAADDLVDRAHDRPQRLRRVALEPQQLRRARVADQQARDQVGLCGVRRSDRQPEPEDREQAARDEQNRGDDEQDQRGAVAVARPDAEGVHERAGDTADLLVVQQVDQRVDEDERERVERGDHDAVRARPVAAASARAAATSAHAAADPGDQAATRQSQYAPVTAPALQHRRHRPAHQAQVVPQRPVRHVQVVEPHHLLERDLAAAEHLPEAGHAGPERQPLSAPVLDVPVLARDQRPRPDEAHLAASTLRSCGSSSIDSLPQDATDAGHARVVGDLEHPRVAVGVDVQVRDGLLQLLGVRHHRPELEDRERRPADTDPRLAEEDRPAAVEEDRERDQQEAPAQSSRSAISETSDVDRPLRAASPTRRAPRREAQNRDAFDRADAGARADQLEVARDDVDLDERVLERADQRQHLLVRAREKAMITRSTSWVCDDRLEIVSEGRGSSGRSRLSRCSLGSASTNPTTLTPYSGCRRSFSAIV